MASKATYIYKGHRIQVNYNYMDKCFDYEVHHDTSHELIFVSDDRFDTIEDALQTAKYEIDSLFS